MAEKIYEGKVALITGGSMGLGYAVAEGFAEQGATVVLAARRKEPLDEAVEKFKAKGYQAYGIQCDVADPKQVEAMVDEAVEKFGHIDACFDNAGIQVPAAPTGDVPVEDAQKLISINLLGAWYTLKFVIKQMEKQGSGAIVCCSSQNGTTASVNRSLYTAAKHGIVGMCKSAGCEYARQGIRVNSVLVGTFETPMLQWLRDEGSFTDDEAYAKIPMNRYGELHELADVVTYLCSDKASYITGAAIPVEGGYIAW